MKRNHRQFLRQGDVPRAAAALQRSLNRHNNALSAYQLAEFYYSGQGVAQSYTRSADLYLEVLKAPRTGRYVIPEAATKQTEARAVCAIACLCRGLYFYDQGDREKAAANYRTAARLGPTGCPQGDAAVSQARDNLAAMSGRHLTPEELFTEETLAQFAAGLLTMHPRERWATKHRTAHISARYRGQLAQSVGMLMVLTRD
ncbi:hypothetical protein WJX72_011756 [[Myrmecia] bisecta]|uniref:Tetratricopeptide repeat protein n=1 Tax=[Myrmecia] bisecta TaxID=41462 RepID=A0AAW1P787_9CHLO